MSWQKIIIPFMCLFTLITITESYCQFVEPRKKKKRIYIQTYLDSLNNEEISLEEFEKVSSDGTQDPLQNETVSTDESSELDPFSQETSVENNTISNKEIQEEGDRENRDVNSFVESKNTTAQIAQGFRIQIMASSSQESLLSQKSEVELRLKLKAYIKMVKPYYKMYVGNFTKRSDAEYHLTIIRANGYAKAWIVPSEIELP